MFVLFGAGKFIAHAAEADSFDTYGLPAPGVFAYAIGGLELLCGALLLAGLLTRVAATLMAVNMSAAIALSGIGQGEVVPSLTLAPALLVAMAFLAWTGPGGGALDERLAARRAIRGP